MERDEMVLRGFKSVFLLMQGDCWYVSILAISDDHVIDRCIIVVVSAVNEQFISAGG